MIDLSFLGTYVPPVLKTYFLYPVVFFLFPFLVIVLWAIVFWPHRHKKGVRHRRSVAIMIGFMRTLIMALVLTAIASPFLLRERTLTGEPTLTVLIDNSTSMELYDLSEVSGMIQSLRERVDVEVVSTGSASRSTPAQDTVSQSKTGDTVLVISDGRITDGLLWGDAALIAKSNNVTLHALDLSVMHNDYSVQLLSPTKTTVGTETAIGVVIDSVSGFEPVHVTLAIDGKVVYDETTDEDVISLTERFQEGYHTIRAEIVPQGDDYFEENNVAYRVIKVLPRPHVALVGHPRSPLATIASQLYTLDTLGSVPDDLSEYHTVILDDIPASALSAETIELLTDYVVDGNGLFVVGGQQSYDVGGYKNHQFETILPAFVGATEASGGASSVVIVLDISASTGYSIDGGERSVDVEKALTLEALKDVGNQHQIGIVAFNDQSYEVYPLRFNPDREVIEEKVSRLYDFRGTRIDMGILHALEMLQNAVGSKSIILISDGRMLHEEKAHSAAFLAADQGVKIYAVGVGANTDEQLMGQLARLTHGTYFRASNVNRLKLLFGDPESLQADSGARYAKILDSNHFITENVELDAEIGGFNYVVPKSTAQLLVSTSAGESLAAVWRIGLGRVATLATDDGRQYAGELYTMKNSALLVRMMNWLVGSPDRLQNRVIDVAPAYVNRRTDVTVTQDIPPEIAGLDFGKSGERMYVAEIIPKTTGFHTLEDVTYAVNPDLEFVPTGENPNLEGTVKSTGGMVMTPDQVDELVNQIQSKSTRKIIRKEPFRWPLVALALVLYLLELFIRRVAHHRLKNKLAHA